MPCHGWPRLAVVAEASLSGPAKLPSPLGNSGRPTHRSLPGNTLQPQLLACALNLRRAPLTRRSLARHTGTTLRVLALIYAHGALLALRGAPYHPHPPRTA